MNTRNQFTITLLFAGCFMGCSQQSTTSLGEPAAGDAAVAAATDISSTAMTKAIAAKDALFVRLSSRLMEVMGSKGPVSAIEVCRKEAPAIAAEIGKQHNVAIGRTSFKLRNSENTPPEWAEPLVKQRVSDPRFVSLPNDRTGALLPIRLKAQCLTCHGERETLAEDVRAGLDAVYPDDQATGFRQGDLRGWFWVEVSADTSPPQPGNTTSATTTNNADTASVDVVDPHESGDAHPQGHGRGQGRGMGRGRGMGFGRGMRQGENRPGRGPGFGRGPEMRADMTTLHAMFDQRDQIKREVKLLPNGAVATTESDDDQVANLIQEHVPAMESRVHEDNPLPPMTFHPVFVGLIKHADDYTLSYEETAKGIEVTYEASDPFVIMLVQEHAKLVSRFIKNGMEEIHKPYTLPKLEPATTE